MVKWYVSSVDYYTCLKIYKSAVEFLKMIAQSKLLYIERKWEINISVLVKHCCFCIVELRQTIANDQDFKRIWDTNKSKLFPILCIRAVNWNVNITKLDTSQLLDRISCARHNTAFTNDTWQWLIPCGNMCHKYGFLNFNHI